MEPYKVYGNFYGISVKEYSRKLLRSNQTKTNKMFEMLDEGQPEWWLFDDNYEREAKLLLHYQFDKRLNKGYKLVRSERIFNSFELLGLTDDLKDVVEGKELNLKTLDRYWDEIREYVNEHKIGLDEVNKIKNEKDDTLEI